MAFLLPIHPGSVLLVAPARRVGDNKTPAPPSVVAEGRLLERRQCCTKGPSVSSTAASGAVFKKSYKFRFLVGILTHTIWVAGNIPQEH